MLETSPIIFGHTITRKAEYYPEVRCLEC